MWEPNLFLYFRTSVFLLKYYTAICEYSLTSQGHEQSRENRVAKAAFDSSSFFDSLDLSVSRSYDNAFIQKR